jgi:hypothetical protein
MYPLIFFGLASISALIHLSRIKKRTSPQTIETILLWLMVWCIGAQGIFAAVFQIWMPGMIAEKIGWQASPFEFEVAVGNLGMGVAGLLALIWRGKYWLGPLITYLIFIYGAAYGHIVQQRLGDTSQYNSGIFLYIGDIIIPSIILIFTVLFYLTVLPKYDRK